MVSSINYSIHGENKNLYYTGTLGKIIVNNAICHFSSYNYIMLHRHFFTLHVTLYVTQVGTLLVIKKVE